MIFSSHLAEMHLGQIAANSRSTSQDIKALRSQVSTTNDILIDFAIQSTEMQVVIERGLLQLHEDLQQIHSNIDQLVQLTKNPEQTWAWEQFRIALDAHRDEHWQESLSFLERAINGAGDHTGFALEPSFHLLRGRLLSGEDSGEDVTQTNLEEAAEAYQRAGKYAKRSKPDMAARSYWLAGTVFFGLGNTEAALKNYRTSSELDPMYLPALEGLGQAYFVIGEQEKATAYFELSLKRDLKRAVAYVQDPAAEALLPVTGLAIERVRKDLEAQVTEYISLATAKKVVALSTSNHLPIYVTQDIDRPASMPTIVDAGIVDLAKIRTEIVRIDKRKIETATGGVTRHYKACVQELLKSTEKQKGWRALFSRGDEAIFEQKYKELDSEKKQFELVTQEWLNLLENIPDETGMELFYPERELMHYMVKRFAEIEAGKHNTA